MKKGRLLKAYGGYFFVADLSTKEVYECKIRGRLKQKNVEVVVGDLVQFNVLDDDSGIIEDKLERKNLLFRPSIANVDQVVITFSISNPKLHYKLLDRFLILAEAAGLEIIICINKVDLSNLEEVKDLMKPYEEIGYRVIYTSTEDNRGIKRLKLSLKDKISVFAGQSGVGKSSLLNAVQPDLELEMGEVSTRIGRGKHTTRYVKLLALNEGGWVADTPGFSSLDLDFITTSKLQYLFPEMREYINQCKFRGCSHSHEPKCTIKKAVEAGEIWENRYSNYLEFLKEINEKKKWRN